MRIRKAAATAIAGTALTLGLIATPSAASATPTDTERASPQSVPDCVSVTKLSDRTVRVHNGCGLTKKVKVIWAFAPDGPCWTMAAGDTKHETSYYPSARFDGLESC